MPASLIREYIGEEIWNTYYKFCFERNPWDKAISLYYWKNKLEPRPTLEDFIQNPLSEYGLYSIDGKLAVDKVYRFEEIDKAMKDIAEKVGLPEKPKLPVTKNSTNKSAKKDYKTIYTESSKDRIAQEFSREINLMGYRF